MHVGQAEVKIKRGHSTFSDDADLHVERLVGHFHADLLGTIDPRFDGLADVAEDFFTSVALAD